MRASDEVRAHRKNPDVVETRVDKMSRWAAPVALVAAVVALALAIWGLFSESSNTPATALAGDPKTRVCTAFETVTKAVPLQTNNDLGPEPVAQAAVAANARLALFGGGQYLLNTSDSATPSELADPMRLVTIATVAGWTIRRVGRDRHCTVECVTEHARRSRGIRPV